MINKYNINTTYSEEFILAKQYFNLLCETYSPNYALSILSNEVDFNIGFREWKLNQK